MESVERPDQACAPEFPIVDVAPDAPIRHARFTITELKQVPSIFSWAGPGSDPRERGTDSPHADFRAIADSHGASWWR
jgi:hypothetical protein